MIVLKQMMFQKSNAMNLSIIKNIVWTLITQVKDKLKKKTKR